MLVRVLLFISSLTPLVTFSQEKYFSYNEVEFSTDIEKRTVQSLLQNNGEIVDGFLVISPDDSTSFSQWKAYYSKEIEIIKGRKPSKKIEKNVKYIYDQLHEKFLRKYENIAFFDQIFEKGVYNCVTAVALYAMAFEEFGIPYNIKETPTHVYIVADPGGAQLLIETTDPISGFKTFTPGFKELFVAQLGMMKLVDQNEIASKGIYPVFEEHYFGGNELTLTELVGIQYYNLGVSHFQNKDYQSAWNALSKAQLFHSNKQLDKLLFASIVSTVSGSDYSDWNDIKLLPYLERFLDFDIKKTNLIGEFQRMLNYVLVSDNDIQKAEKAYNYYIERSVNEEIQKEISYCYYYERSVIAYNRASYSEAFEFIIKAYKSKPGNSSAENLLMDSFRMAYQNKSSDIALARLDTLIANNPILVDNNHINRIRLNLYLVGMGENFDSKRAQKGNSLKELFESTILKNSNYIYDENLLANAYSKAAVYYFNRGYSTKARNIIQAGLKFAPGNYQLKSRMRMINN